MSFSHFHYCFTSLSQTSTKLTATPNPTPTPAPRPPIHANNYPRREEHHPNPTTQTQVLSQQPPPHDHRSTPTTHASDHTHGNPHPPAWPKIKPTKKNNVVNSNTRANQPKNNVIKQIDKEGLVVFRK